MKLLRLSTLFRVDGPIKSVHNFVQESPNEARLVLEGMKLYETLGRVLTDE